MTAPSTALGMTVMMQAALFNVRAAIEGVDDPQLQLAVNLLAAAISNAGNGLTPAVASDIEFALNDLAGVAEQYGLLLPYIEQLRADLASFNATLPDSLISAIQALQTKLKARRKAIERQTFIEGGGEPLPHPPAELRAEALPIREQLAAAGFTTPALDALIDDPESLRMHGIIAIVDELEVVSGT